MGKLVIIEEKIIVYFVNRFVTKNYSVALSLHNLPVEFNFSVSGEKKIVTRF